MKHPPPVVAALAAFLATFASASAHSTGNVLVLEIENRSVRMKPAAADFVTDAVRKAVSDSAGGRMNVLTRESLSALPASLKSCVTELCLHQLAETVELAPLRLVVGGSLRDVDSRVAISLVVYDVTTFGLVVADTAFVKNAKEAAAWVDRTFQAKVQCLGEEKGLLELTNTTGGATVEIRGPNGFGKDGVVAAILPWGPECVQPGTYTVAVSGFGLETAERVTDVLPWRRTRVDASAAQLVVACPPPTDGYVLVPSGSFTMGSRRPPPGMTDEAPAHTVRISGRLCVKTSEVTQREWRELMGTSPAGFAACGDDCPVENVSWWDALEYCNALSRRDGYPECYRLSGCNGRRPGEGLRCKSASVRSRSCPGYRIPTEAEWEHAARAGDPVAAPDAEGSAWHLGNSAVAYAGADGCDPAGGGAESGRCGPHQVRGKRPNAWGIHDMLGNVWEWCWDRHGPYPATVVDDPSGPAAGEDRVVRGGAFDSELDVVRCAARSRANPGEPLPNTGFRTVRTWSPDTR